jgi:large subunit ribosomal protein L23
MIELLRRVERPHITEKSTQLKDATNTLCFRVGRESTKVDVKNAVEKIFGVKVTSVRMLNVKGKPKRVGRWSGYRASWKKAYVRLKPGEKSIEYFEGV